MLIHIDKSSIYIENCKVKQQSNQCKLSITKAMNSVIFTDCDYAYHTIANVEFTGVLDRYKIEGFIQNEDNPEIITKIFNYICDYHLFIKYGDKVYMDVQGIGDIVISFDELQKNKYWKHYYDLSLMLTKDKHLVVQDLENSDDQTDHKHKIYKEERFWSIASAFIDGSYQDKTKKVVNNKYNCYYKISPYDLENMGYSSQKEVNTFTQAYMMRYEVQTKLFDYKSVYYNTFVIDYCMNLIEEEIDELTTIFEDEKFLANLEVFNNKTGMNEDIRMIIHNHLINS